MRPGRCTRAAVSGGWVPSPRCFSESRSGLPRPSVPWPHGTDRQAGRRQYHPGAVGLAVGGLVTLASRDTLISVTLGLSVTAAAVLITNLPPGGFVANWVLPMVPATVGA